VFRSEHTRSEAYFRDTAGVAGQVLDLHDDPLSLEAVEQYFRLYYWEQQQRWDRHGIVSLFHLDSNRELPFLFGFASAAERFRVIEETQRPVIIPWREEGRRLCDALRWGPDLPSRRLLCALQPYTVTIPNRLWERELGRSFETVHDRFPVLSSPQLQYSETYGLALEGLAGEALIA
jgi:CRISPR-associated endonuclease/helicase Cas3